MRNVMAFARRASIGVRHGDDARKGGARRAFTITRKEHGMSTKKTVAAACAGCEKRDATIKRQAEENTGLRGTAEYWCSEWHKMRGQWEDAIIQRDSLAGQRDTLQSRIDSFIKTCADIRAVCVDTGIEHADKMATLTAVKALAENAKESKRYIGFDFGGKDEASYCVCSFGKNGVMTVHDSGTYKMTPYDSYVELTVFQSCAIGMCMFGALVGVLVTLACT